jgi:aspartate 1-decarboxylase
MLISMLKSKIHRAAVTQAELSYVGSVTIDSALMEAAGIYEYEKVQIANINNGNRFDTYVIAGEKGSGIVCLNGAAARCALVGDKIIIMAYSQMTVDEVKKHSPKIVIVSDDDNKVTKVMDCEKHGKFHS